MSPNENEVIDMDVADVMIAILALKDLLVAKGVFTDEEWKKSLDNVVESVREEPSEEAPEA